MVFPWPLPAAADSWWSRQDSRSAEIVRELARQRGTGVTILDVRDPDLRQSPMLDPEDGRVHTWAPGGQSTSRYWQLRLGYQLDGDHPTARAPARALRVRTR